MPRRLLSLFLIVAAPVAASAQSTRSDTLFSVEKYLDYETVGEPRISPDGSQIVYTRRWVDRINDEWKNSLWIMGADGSRNRFLGDGSAATWAPDSKRIAYLADGQPGGTQVWVKYIDAEGASQITRVNADQSPANLRWSPDGQSIGFTLFVGTPDSSAWSIDMPKAPEGAKWTKSPQVVRRLHYRADRRGFLQPGYAHLYVVPADGGTARAITSGDWSLGAPFDQLPGGVGWDWLPGGKSVVVDGLKVANSDTIYRDAYLYRVDVATGAARLLTPDRGSWQGPVVSPDGKWIAFAGQPYSRMSYRASDVYVMATDGTGMRKLSGDFDRDPGSLVWAPNSNGVYFSAGDKGAIHVYFAGLEGGVRPVTSGEEVLQLSSVSKTGIAIGVLSRPQGPPDVVRFALTQPQTIRTLTHVNADLLENMRLASVEEIWYTSSGNQRVQGWIVKPPSFDPSKKYPLIMEIHGGPHGMYNVAFNPMYQNFAANGYVVLYTNPRGSTGYGTPFGNAIERAYPSVDYDDLMAGVDAVIAKGYVDSNNMFVGGCSGGGVLTSWIIGHTNRFKAAAVRCPVINWLSFAGQTDVPFFTYNFFEKPFWENPEPWLRQSPLMHVGKVKTPTLIMTGVLDLRTPMPQSEEYYSALKVRGVPSVLLRFEGEYHGTSSRPSNWMRTQLYMMDWYQRWGSLAPKRTAER